MKNVIQTFWLSVLVGCAAVETPKETVLMNTGHEEIAKAAIAELQKKGDWYQVVDSTTLRVANPPPGYLMPTIEKAASMILLKGRSSAFSKRMLQEIIERLEAENIAYEIVYFDGDTWLVWEKRASEIVNETTRDVARPMNIRQISDDDFKYQVD